MKAKREATQQVLGELFDEAAAMKDFAHTVFIALRQPSMGEEGAAVATVVGNMLDRLLEMKGILHDLVEWA